jgi:hypothetical protein
MRAESTPGYTRFILEKPLRSETDVNFSNFDYKHDTIRPCKKYVTGENPRVVNHKLVSKQMQVLRLRTLTLCFAQDDGLMFMRFAAPDQSTMPCETA